MALGAQGAGHCISLVMGHLLSILHLRDQGIQRAPLMTTPVDISAKCPQRLWLRMHVAPHPRPWACSLGPLPGAQGS